MSMIQTNKTAIKILFLALLFIIPFGEIGAKPSPKIKIAKKKIELGIIYNDDPIKVFYIDVVNKGNDKLKISKVIPDCDCTTVEYDRTPIEPKGEKKIKVTVNLTGFLPVEIEKQVAVYSNSKKSPVIVTITGKIIYK